MSVSSLVTARMASDEAHDVVPAGGPHDELFAVVGLVAPDRADVECDP